MSKYQSISPPLMSEIYGEDIYDSILYGMNGINYYNKQDWYDFNRYYSIDINKEMPSGKHYIFICRPDLYLVDQDASGRVTLSNTSLTSTDSLFKYLRDFHPEIISSLTGEFADMKRPSAQYSSFGGLTAGSLSGHGNAMNSDGSVAINASSGSQYTLPNHVFIPFLTGRVESIQLPDYSIQQQSVVQPYTNYTMPYTTHALESITGGTFNINFREDVNYSIHKMMYAWIYYQDGVRRNKFRPKQKYITYRSFDYATSVYDFIVDDTGENVIYWGKYTGAIPNTASMSDLSFNKGSPAETSMSVPFNYFIHEHMDMDILVDFQLNSLGTYSLQNYFNNGDFLNPNIITEPIYNTGGYSITGPSMVGRPIIQIVTENGSKKIKLRWLN